MKLKCIAVDDEPRALEVIKEYIEKIPFLKLCDTFRNPLKAFEYVKQNKVDLIFLDINMPNLSGIQFIKSLTNKPNIILTTAYSEYAVESYGLDVLDYLLKPIEFDRFVKAANKAYDNSQIKENEEVKLPQSDESNQSKAKDFIFVKSGTQLLKIDIDQIKYIKGLGNYMSLYLEDKKVLALAKMSEILDMLSSYPFARVHKSYIVNLTKIKTVENHRIRIGETLIPISNSYRKSFYTLINFKER